MWNTEFQTAPPPPLAPPTPPFLLPSFSKMLSRRMVTHHQVDLAPFMRLHFEVCASSNFSYLEYFLKATVRVVPQGLTDVR